ncbi:hypothetical protein [Pseudomonas spelaei]
MIDQDGYLTFPLYHGTSTLYRDSIEKQGLGAVRDPSLFDFQTLEQLAKLLDAQKSKSTWWQMNDFIVKAMIDQNVTGGGFNFRYGGIYLSASRQTAQMYAKSPKGSEIISHIFLAYEELKSVDPDAASQLLHCAHPLTKLFEKPSMPMLITVSKVKAHLLTTEHGKAIDEQLAEMKNLREARDPHLIDVIWQQRNFTFDGTLEPHTLMFEEL